MHNPTIASFNPLFTIGKRTRVDNDLRRMKHYCHVVMAVTTMNDDVGQYHNVGTMFHLGINTSIIFVRKCLQLP